MYFSQDDLRLSPIVCVCSSAQSCNPMDYSPPGSSVHGILQARILEWVGISFSRGSSQPKDPTHISCVSCIGSSVQSLNHVRLFVTPWTAAHQAFLSITDFWNLLKRISIKSVAGGFSTTEPLGKPLRLSNAM